MRLETRRQRGNSGDAAAQMASRRLHHAAQASARRQEAFERSRTPTGSGIPVRGVGGSGTPLGGPRPSPLRCRSVSASAGAPSTEWAKGVASPAEAPCLVDAGRTRAGGVSAAEVRRLSGEFARESRQPDGQDAAALVAEANKAAARGTATLLDFVSAQMSAMDAAHAEAHARAHGA